MMGSWDDTCKLLQYYYDSEYLIKLLDAAVRIITRIILNCRERKAEIYGFAPQNLVGLCSRPQPFSSSRRRRNSRTPRSLLPQFLHSRRHRRTSLLSV